MEIKKGTLSLADIQSMLKTSKEEMWTNYNKNHTSFLAKEEETKLEKKALEMATAIRAGKAKEKDTPDTKKKSRKTVKGKKKKVYHRANRMKKAEAREALYSTGAYCHYKQLGKDETLIRLSDPDQVWGISEKLSAKEGMALAEKLMAYKDAHCKKYSKTREVGKKDKNGKKKSKAYKNIYAHELIFMLPKEYFKGWKTLDPAVFVPLLLKQIDPRAGRLLWCAKVYKSAKVMYLRVIVFSYCIFKKPLKIRAKYDSNYYWNPETKRRCKESDEKAVLLHKKGEVKKDKKGNEIFTECTFSPKALRIFCYTQQVDYSSLSGFELMMEHIKQAFVNAFAILECGKCTAGRSRIRKMKWKKTYAQSTLLKVRAVNKLVDMINGKLGRIYSSFEAGGFFEDKEIAKAYRWLRHRLAEIVHGNSFKYHNIKVIMNFKGHYETFKEKVVLMEYKVNEIFAEFDEMVQPQLAF